MQSMSWPIITIIERNPKKFAIAVETLGNPATDIQLLCVDVATLRKSKDVAFVSPANSIGFMDGGIDFAYSRKMFQGVEGRVKGKIQQLGKTTARGRYYLDIGSAIAVVASKRHRSLLIAAPTMFLPHDVSRTNNAFHATVAALCLAQRMDVKHVIIPLMCTGYGCMRVDVALRQMLDAINVVRTGFVPEMDSDSGHLSDPKCFIIANPFAIVQQQPITFQNKELRDMFV